MLVSTRKIARNILRMFAMSLTCLLVAGTAWAQMEDPTTQQGLKPYAAYHGGDFDSVSLVNGKLDLHVPLATWPQRGNLKLGFTIRYDNPQLIEDRDIPGTCGTTGNPCTYTSTFSGGGVQIISDLAYGIYQQAVIDPNGVLVGYIYSVQDPSGATHPLGNTGGTVYESTDATGYSWNSSTNVITNRSGTRYYNTSAYILSPGMIPPPVAKAEDPNGNQITYAAGVFNDTIGRTISTNETSTTNYTGCTGQLPISSAKLWIVPGPNGANVTYTLCYADVTLNVMLEPGQYHYADTSTHSMLQSIILPNNTTWTFDYDNNASGALTKVTMPTGGTISYGYAVRHTCGPYSNTRWPHYYEYAVGGRTVDPQDGSGSGTWSYLPDVNYGIIQNVTDPAGNQTVHTISALGSSCSLYETQTQYYQGAVSANVLIKTIQTDYSWVQSTDLYDGASVIINVVPIRVTTTWPVATGTKVTKVEKDYDSGFTFTDITGTQHIGTFGNVVAERNYDFGSGAVGALLRRTAISYVSLSNASYKNLNLVDTVSAIATYDSLSNTCNGAAGTCAYEYFGYDEYGLAPSGITTRHNAAPVNGTLRGNRTSLHRWVNTTNTYLNTTRTFFDTGLVNVSTDPGGHATTYVYSSSFAGAYPTEMDLPDTSSPNLTHHKTFANYDFNTGLLTSTTDENSNVTAYSYDSIRRLQSVIPPSAGGMSTFTYTDTPGSVKVEKQTEISSTSSTDEYVLVDGLGRETSRVIANDESAPWDKTDRCYDTRGLRTFASYPYQASTLSASRTCSGLGDSYTYDALSRNVFVMHSDSTYVATTYNGAATSVVDEGNGTSTIRRISQVDGLGRQISVCEVNDATLIGITGVPAACNQDIAATGFLTFYTYDTLGNLTGVSQGGLNARTFSYDSVSRLVSATNPESGTTSYTYDADGNAITRIRPAPNQTGSATTTTIMMYDQLHRLTSKTYSDATPPVMVNYDEATAFGVSLGSNTVGRMTSEYTGSSSAKLGGSIYAYDNVGHLLSNSQCTPQNCATGTFPVIYSYDLAGNMLTATNGLGTTLTYTYNRPGRITSIASNLLDSNHPPTLLSQIQYNAFGSEMFSSLGDTNSEARTYTSRGWLYTVQAGNPTSTSGTQGTGSVTVGGSERTYQDPGAPETGSVSITGTERSKTTCFYSHGIRLCNDPIYDYGTVTITAGGHSTRANYGQGDTYVTVATKLASAINADTGAMVTATSSTNIVNLTSKAKTASWISLSATSATSDPPDFSIASFTATPSGSGLTGGRNPGPVIYDTGTVTITVNGAPISVNFGQGSTGSSVAQTLATAITSSSAFVTSISSGATVNLTSRIVGAAGDYPLSSSSATTESGTFSGSSFTTSTSGSSLTGGSGGTVITPSVYSLTVGYAPDGTVTSSNDSVNGNWAYTYDKMNRLVTSTANTQAFAYVYDRFGNRWQQNVTLGSGYGTSYVFAANNRIIGSGISYDAAGNVIADGTHTYSYDAENRIAAVDGGSTVAYTYDATGARISKTSAGGSVDYIYDLTGHVITEVSSGGTWSRGEVYAGGRHLATYSGGAGGVTYFSYSDWLSSERARTTLSGAGAVAETCQNLPYGDGQVCTGSDPSPLHFTGKMRDIETGLDDFPARYYSAVQGRWYSPDWASAQVPVPYADLGNPQTLNLYDYVGGDPTNHPDADGHFQAPGQEANDACAGNPQCAENKEGQAQDQTVAQNQTDTTAAAATVATTPAAAPTTTEEINAVVKPLVESAVGAGEKAGSFLLDAAENVGGAILFVFTAGVGHTATEEQDTVHITPTPENAHKTGERESTREKHEEGQARRSRDRGGEKGDARRRPPRKPPNGWKGPWPPKEGQPWN